MARITVEDCLNVVQDRFELVLLAGKRAREIAMTVGEHHDKDDVLALKEIGSGYLDINELRQRFLYFVHNIPYFSQEESDELEEFEMYEEFEATPSQMFGMHEVTDSEQESAKGLRIDEYQAV